MFRTDLGQGQLGIGGYGMYQSGLNGGLILDLGDVSVPTGELVDL